MSQCVVIAVDAIGYPQGGGHLWVYLNWALSLRSIGYRVLWLETVRSDAPMDRLASNLASLKRHLEPFGFQDSIMLANECARSPFLPKELDYLDLDASDGADLLLNFKYGLSANILRRFKRSALIDIDPGLLQLWMRQGQVSVASHDLYFTIGETIDGDEVIGANDAHRWIYTPPCVSIEHWPAVAASPDEAFTTVTHWFAEEWIELDGRIYRNDKRSGFLPFLDLPSLTREQIELAAFIGDDEAERDSLTQRGWRVLESAAVASTPLDYRRYIQGSKGEFSCCKPSCVLLQNAWISDRTLCYLASGKPAIVQHTGRSRWLPDRAGLLRFRDLRDAAQCVELASRNYVEHSLLARALAEEYFNGNKVVRALIGQCL